MCFVTQQDHVFQINAILLKSKYRKFEYSSVLYDLTLYLKNMNTVFGWVESSPVMWLQFKLMFYNWNLFTTKNNRYFLNFEGFSFSAIHHYIPKRAGKTNSIFKKFDFIIFDPITHTRYKHLHFEDVLYIKYYTCAFLPQIFCISFF